jgi:hypothetical protein
MVIGFGFCFGGAPFFGTTFLVAFLESAFFPPAGGCFLDFFCDALATGVFFGANSVFVFLTQEGLK